MIEHIANEVILNVWAILTIVLTSFLGGGAVTIAIAGTIAKNILSNEASIKAVEGLTDSVPADIAKKILELAETSKPVIELIEEAFDGVPAETKTEQHTTQRHTQIRLRTQYARRIFCLKP